MFGSQHSAGSGDTRAGLTSSAAGDIQYHPPQKSWNTQTSKAIPPQHNCLFKEAQHRWLLHSLAGPVPMAGGVSVQASLKEKPKMKLQIKFSQVSPFHHTSWELFMPSQRTLQGPDKSYQDKPRNLAMDINPDPKHSFNQRPRELVPAHPGQSQHQHHIRWLRALSRYM